MFKFRTIAHLIEIFVLPEIEKRIKAGTLKESDLPIELYQFRAIQKKLANGSVTPIVELNEEVQLLAQVKLKRKVFAGEPLTKNDIYPEECFISSPVYEGKAAAYFLCQSLLFEYLLIYDCRPSLPDFSEEELERNKSPYPMLDFINAKNFNEIVKPIEKIKILSNSNWPPAPGYYPQVLLELHKNPTGINDQSFSGAVSNSYNIDYWNKRLDFWNGTNFFPNRLTYLKRAIDAHFNKDYIASIYVLVPQFEGIIRDYLIKSGNKPKEAFFDKVEDLQKLILSREILMFPRGILDTVFDYLKTGTFWKHTNTIADPKTIINRHGVVHGVFKEFECEEISLKYLILLDALFFVLLHDKMLTKSI